MVVSCLGSILSVALLGVVVLPARQVVIPNLAGDHSDANEIFRLENDAMEQWRQGNPMRWAEISADDVIYVDPGLATPVVGIESYRKYLDAIAGKVHYDASEFVAPRVALNGDLAVLTYNYHSLGKDKEGKLQRTSFWNTTEVYRRSAGSWRIAHSHWSYIGHQPSADVVVPVPVRRGEIKPEGAAAELLALESGAMARWRRGDSFGFSEISVPEVTYFDSGTPARLNGLGELKAEYKKRESKIAFEVMDFIDPLVRVCGDSALLFYRFFSTTLHPDGSVKSRTPWNCTEVFAKQDGQWRIVHTHWSHIQIPPQNAAL